MTPHEITLSVTSRSSKIKAGPVGGGGDDAISRKSYPVPQNSADFGGLWSVRQRGQALIESEQGEPVNFSRRQDDCVGEFDPCGAPQQNRLVLDFRDQRVASELGQ